MKNLIEQDVQHYWRVMQASMPLAEFRDELEVLELVTESEALRRACNVALDIRDAVFGRRTGKLSA